MKVALLYDTSAKLPDFLQPYFTDDKGNPTDVRKRAELARMLEYGAWQEDVRFDKSEEIAEYLRENRGRIFKETVLGNTYAYCFYKPRINAYRIPRIYIEDVDTEQLWSIVCRYSGGMESVCYFTHNEETNYLVPEDEI